MIRGDEAMKKIAAVVLVGVALSGCSQYGVAHDPIVKGAVVGAVTGAAAGGVASGNLGGAAIGAGVGALVGGAIAAVHAHHGYAPAPGPYYAKP
jgi:hypothetical protein